MTLSTRTQSIQKAVPKAPLALRKLLRAADELKTARAILLALQGDLESTEAFLRLSRVMLPGRRLSAASEAVPLLGEMVSMRLALLSAGTVWMKSIAGTSGVFAPLFRHAVASATCAEPLGRDSGIVDPLHAYVLGLLHHVGELAAFSNADLKSVSQEEIGELGAEMMRAIDTPASLSDALMEYSILKSNPAGHLGVDATILGAADVAATLLGYAAPIAFQQPNRERFELLAQSMVASGKRLCVSVEEAVGTLLEDERAASRRDALEEISPLALADALDKTSARDLGPLPVLFSRVSTATDDEELAVALTAGIVEELGADRAYFLRIDNGRMRSAVLSVRGNAPHALPNIDIGLDRLCLPLRSVLTAGQPVLHPSRDTGLEFLHSQNLPQSFFVPIALGRETMGLLGVEMRDPRATSPDLLAAVGAHAAIAIKAVDLKRLSDAAKIDELTGLFNRRGILEALDKAMQMPDLDSRGLAVALIDCDHLKMVNDNFGHLYGDEYLRRISEVVRLTLRGTDQFGRYGGDEFLAILPDIDFQNAQQIFDRTRERVELAGLESKDGLLLSVSIGVVVRGRSDAGREKLIKLADTALYQVKQEGRNAVRVIDAEKPPSLTI